MSLPGYEFRARFVMAEAQKSSGSREQGLETLRRLKQDAEQRGFRLIARKASEAESRFHGSNNK